MTARSAGVESAGHEPRCATTRTCSCSTVTTGDCGRADPIAEQRQHLGERAALVLDRLTCLEHLEEVVGQRVPGMTRPLRFAQPLVGFVETTSRFRRSQRDIDRRQRRTRLQNSALSRQRHGQSRPRCGLVILGRREYRGPARRRGGLLVAPPLLSGLLPGAVGKRLQQSAARAVPTPRSRLREPSTPRARDGRAPKVRAWHRG